MDFPKAVKVILHEEGGLADHPSDPGGVTNFGISIRFAGSVGLDLDRDGRTTRADIVALTREQAGELYRQHFWLKMKCDRMPYPLALCVFDGAVNQGPAPIAKLMQRALGVVADGVIGPKTLAAAQNVTDSQIDRFMAKRAKRYAETANFDVFAEGWLTRLFRVRRASLL